MMARLASRLVSVAMSHPGRTIAAIVTVVVCLAPFATRLSLNLDSRALLLDVAPGLREHDHATALFQATDTIVIAVTSGETLFRPSSVARLFRLTSAVASLDGIRADSVQSLATLSLPAFDSALSTRPLLPLQATADQAACARAWQDVVRLAVNDGVLVSADGRGWVILARTLPSANRARLLEGLRALAAGESSPGERVSLGGTTLAEAALGAAASADLLRMLPSALVLLTGALALRLGAIRAAVAIVEVGAAMTIAAGIAGLLGIPLFITSLVLPVILLAVGITDNVHAMEGIAAAGPDDPRAADRVTRALLIAAVTTIAGMAGMAFATLRPLRSFGLLAAIALACSSILTLTLVPALHVILQRFAPIAPRRRAAGAASRRRWGTLATAMWLAALVPAIVVALPRIQVNDSWVWNLPRDHDVALGARVLDARFAGATTLEFAVDAGEDGGWLQPRGFDRLMRLAAALERDESVGAVTSVAGDLLRARALLEEDDVAAVRLRIAGDTTGAELSDAFALLASRRDSRLEERLDASQRVARVTVFVRGADHATLQRLLARARAEAERLQVRLRPFGEGWLSTEAVDRLVGDQLQSIGFALAFDWMFVAAVFRSVRAGLAASLPVALAIVTATTLLGLAGVPAGIANTMFMAIAIGIGNDFAVHVICAHRESDGDVGDDSAGGIAAVRSPLLASAAGLACGFAALLLAAAPPTRQLGATLLIVVVSAAASSLVLVPRLLAHAPDPVNDARAGVGVAWRLLAGGRR